MRHIKCNWKYSPIYKLQNQHPQIFRIMYIALNISPTNAPIIQVGNQQFELFLWIDLKRPETSYIFLYKWSGG